MQEISEEYQLALVSPLQCVKNEIHNILTVLRLTKQFTSSARFHSEVTRDTESPIVTRFQQLFDSLTCVNEFLIDVSHFDPFLFVIESELTNGPITAVALAAVNKFVAYGLIQVDALGCAQAINAIALGVLQCRFQASGSAADEVVLLKILGVLVDTLRCPAGEYLSDETVWLMVKKAYQISRQPRASYLLRSNSESILLQMVLTIFGCHKSRSRKVRVHTERQVVVQPYGIECMYKTLKFLAFLTAYGHQGSSNSSTTNKQRSQSPTCATNSATHRERSGSSNGSAQEDWTLGFGYNPTTESSEFCDEMRSLGLTLLNVALETGGPEVAKSDMLIAVVQDDICKSLLLNSRTESLFLLSVALRSVFLLFQFFKRHLKVQLEVFFNSIHLRIARAVADRDDSSHFEQRELALESLLEFCREPELMQEVYENYDCDFRCTNLFHTLVAFLTEQACPTTTSSLDIVETSSFTTLNKLALSGILSILHSIATRCQLDAQAQGTRYTTASPRVPRAVPTSGNAPCEALDVDSSTVSSTNETIYPLNNGEGEKETLRIRKEHKNRLALAAQVFNTEPSKCIGPLQNLGVLSINATADAMSLFLKETPGLDLRLVGEYLSKRKEWNTSVRFAFMKSFAFPKMPIVAALKMALSTFRLPGEAQEIERVMDTFAQCYYIQQPISGEEVLKHPLSVHGDLTDDTEKETHEEWFNAELKKPRFIPTEFEYEFEPGEDSHLSRVCFVTSDVVFILSYSIIMLNTDLHNPGVKNKMTLPEFIRNNRGLNDGTDLPSHFLEEIYESVRADQIRLYDDAPSGTDESTCWDRIMKKQAIVDEFSTFVSPQRAGAHERDMISIIWDEKPLRTLRRAFDTTHDHATLLLCISGFTDIARVATYFGQTDVVNLLVANLSPYVNYYCTIRTQLLLPALIQILSQSAHLLREGWVHVIEFLLRLAALDLLPSSMTEFDDFTDSSGQRLPQLCKWRPPRPLPARRQSEAEPRGGKGFLDSLSAWFAAEVESDDEEDGLFEESSHAMSSSRLVLGSNYSGTLSPRRIPAIPVIASSHNGSTVEDSTSAPVLTSGTSTPGISSKKKDLGDSSTEHSPFDQLASFLHSCRLENLVERFRHLPQASMLALMDILIQITQPEETAEIVNIRLSASNPLANDWGGVLRPEIAEIESFRQVGDAIYCLELLTTLACSPNPTAQIASDNPVAPVDISSEIASTTALHLIYLIEHTRKSCETMRQEKEDQFVERLLVNALRLCVRLLDEESLRSLGLDILRELCVLPDVYICQHADRITSAFCILTNPWQQNQDLEPFQQETMRLIMALLFRVIASCVQGPPPLPASLFECTTVFMDNHKALQRLLQLQMFHKLLAILIAVATHPSMTSVTAATTEIKSACAAFRAVQSLEDVLSILELLDRHRRTNDGGMSPTSHTTTQSFVDTYWLPIVQSLSMIAAFALKPTRSKALQGLHRIFVQGVRGADDAIDNLVSFRGVGSAKLWMAGIAMCLLPLMSYSFSPLNDDDDSVMTVLTSIAQEAARRMGPDGLSERRADSAGFVNRMVLSQIDILVPGKPALQLPLSCEHNDAMHLFELIVKVFSEQTLNAPSYLVDSYHENLKNFILVVATSFPAQDSSSVEDSISPLLPKLWTILPENCTCLRNEIIQIMAAPSEVQQTSDADIASGTALHEDPSTTEDKADSVVAT